MKKISAVITSQFSLKKYRLYLIFALCAGVIMIILSNRMNKQSQNTDVEAVSEIAETLDIDFSEKKLEEKLENILSEVSGVGEIKVLVSYESTDEKVVLKDSNGRGSESTVIHGGSSVNEPFVYKSLYPQIGGVMVVAEGGDDYEIKSVIADAVSTVLGIPLYKVKVLKMK